MKAAVIFQKGELPRFAEVAEPTVHHEDELLVTVKAAAIKHFDKGRASGKHYSSDSDTKNAIVIGGDGVGLLEDGTRVFGLGKGMIAEKAIIDKRTVVRLPEGIGDATAASLPNAVAGSAMAMRCRASMKQGETVLINGATGFTGKIAVQLVRHYGAKTIIATGRNEQSLRSLHELGADKIISVQQDDKDFSDQIKSIHDSTPIDIVLDYLWGRTAELILRSLKGTGSFTHRSRFVSIGAATGDSIQLSAENLRSADIQLSGSGLGSWTKEEISLLFSEIIPEAFTLAADNKLKVETENVHLSDIEKMWNIEVPSGKRLVVTM